MPGIDTLGGIGLASDLFGTALDIKELIEGDQTAVALAEISEKLDELLGLSQDILTAVGATQDLITSTYVSDIQSDVKQSLNYLHLYRSTGNAGDAAQAIAKSVEAMSDITTYAVAAPVEQGLLAATMIAAASTRILIINELQDGATSGEFKNELLAARADLEAALPIFEREVLDGIQATPTNIDYGGGGFVPEWADYTYQFTNSAGAAASFVWRLYFNDTDPIFTLGRPATTSEFVGFLYRKGYGGQVETHVDPLLAADLEAYGYADIQEVSAGLDFLTSGAWLRGRDGTVNDVLTSSQAADYLSPDTLDGYRGNDRLTGGRGNDAVRGDEGNDILVGNRGNDTLRGGLGNDVLQGGLGDDRIDGGGGVDRVTYAAATRGVVVSLDLSERQNTRMGYDRLASVEHLDGSAHGDVLKGGTGANTLRGLDGDDVLDGFVGNDRLEGGGGNDILMGGAGKDLLSGGGGKDWASYSAARAAVTVSLANSSLNRGEAAGDRFASIEGLIGSRFNDRLDGANIVHNSIDGGAGRDSIRGFSGNDVLKGGDGNDTLMGGTGGDRLDGGSGVDTASYAASRTGVKAFLADAASNTGEAFGDRFVSVEALTGSTFNDELAGADNVNNIIDGGAGNDRINGYSGKDRLSGGAGDDIFIFDTALNGRTNVDTITDFVRLDDTILLDISIFSAFGAAAPGAAIARSAFKDLSVAAPDANDRILYDRASGGLFYDGDGSGTAHAAVKFAQVEAGTILSAADFMVI